MLSDTDFLRYSPQLLLEEIGLVGQQRLQHSRVTIIGLGGLGCPVAYYLAAAGVGQLQLIDFDTVALANLQRQSLYSMQQLGQQKAAAAASSLRAINPRVSIQIVQRQQDSETLRSVLAQQDLVLDCTDNSETRLAINAAIIQAKIALISGSAAAFSGLLLTLLPPFQDGCYCCLFPYAESAVKNCRQAGILGPVAGIIGASMALQGIKYLACPQLIQPGVLWHFDGLKYNWQRLGTTRATACNICGGI